MNAAKEVSTYLNKNSSTLSVEIVERVLEKLKLEIPLWEKEQAINMYIELLEFFGDSLIAKCNDEESPPEALIQWSKKNAEMQAANGKHISEIAVRYPPTRETFIDLLTDISMELGISLKDNASLIKQINSLLDYSLNATIQAFERLTVQYQEKAEQEITELSAPIVPIKENVVILPLIGEMNENRVEHIMRQAVPNIVNMDTEYVIADFSGVLALNSEIAASLHQIGKVLRLMGIHVITTGLRPEVVQTAVRNGIDMSTSEIYADVKQALKVIDQA